jgi:hypothetical protein
MGAAARDRSAPVLKAKPLPPLVPQWHRAGSVTGKGAQLAPRKRKSGQFFPARSYAGLLKKKWLSSPFGGDSRDATPANLLLTGEFQATALASKVAHLLRVLRPCPFRRPSMAGGRPPLADTPLHHKHSDTAGNDHRQQNPLLTTTTVPEPHAESPRISLHAAGPRR